MDPVVHFEMPYADKARVAAFYESAFDWRMQGLGEEMGSYVLATTTEIGAAGSTRPGAIGGGFFAAAPGAPTCPSVVIAVDDIAVSMDKLRRCGGSVLGEPMDIPGVGRYVAFTDTEGNRVGMLQPIPRNGSTAKPASP